MMQWLTLAGTVVKEVSGWLSRKQDRKEAAQKIKAQWEVAQLERMPWFMTLVAAVHILGPIDYAFYLALSSAHPIESPAEVATAVRAAFDAFPAWFTGLAVAILGAMAGIRMNGQEKVRQSRAREREHKAEAEKEREKRRNREDGDGDKPADYYDRPGR